MPAHIEDYALLGDCETAALVSRDGSIDWLCWPRFDSAACFAALLSDASAGRWQIAPVGKITNTSRRYREGTLVLDTTFETPHGSATVVDFMPPRDGVSDLVRIVQGRRGRVTFRMELIIRFEYGAIVPWVTRLPDGSLRAIAGPDMVVLRGDVPVHGEGLTTAAEFTVDEGEQVAFCLSYGPSHLPLPRTVRPDAALVSTERFWRDWSGKSGYHGEWAEAVNRSLITLKALTYAPTGGIVAAATTSLPEKIGGPRNWDYRYCWLRDATLTLLALMDAGYYDEATAWRDWLLRAAAGSPSQVQIMYGVAGERSLWERELAWLPGYERSRPVRVGNAAHTQLQLDVFGEVMDALHQARQGGLPPNADAWALQCALVSHLETVWERPDEGLWEVRGGPQHFTHSKVMAWVALDRAIKTADELRLPGPIERWRRTRERIHADVCHNAFDATLGSFVQAYGSKQLDASLLLIPLVGFLPANDPRVQGTMAAVEQRLAVDGLLLRYDTSTVRDGLEPGEGAFLACSFWLVDSLVLQGRRVEARRLFERLLGLRNDVGLLAEEYDPQANRFLGNFPQAFSHVALVGSAFNLAAAAERPGGRPAVQRAATGLRTS